MASYVWKGGAGSWTDSRDWIGGVVPLWDGGSLVDIGAGTVTLHGIEPNNMTVLADNGLIVLNNAAFGPSLTVGLADATSPSSTSTLGIVIAGYDTNYGLIEGVAAGAGSYALSISINAYSQLNNLGTIVSAGPPTADNGPSFFTISDGDNLHPAVLNNAGLISLKDDTIANIDTAIIGVGTMKLSNSSGPDGSSPQLTLSGPIAATQTVELDAGQLKLYQSLVQPTSFDATIAGWDKAGTVFLAGTFQGQLLAFTQKSPGHGDLVVSGTDSGFKQTFDLHLAGTYTTSEFAMSHSPLGTTVSILA